MTSEPVVTGGAIVSVATAIIALLIGFDVVSWSAEQVGLVLAVLTAVNVAVTARVRSRVTPVISAQNELTRE